MGQGILASVETLLAKENKIPFAGWATALYAGESDWGLDFSFFKVVIDLTDAGHG